jgi:hypothetical protein
MACSVKVQVQPKSAFFSWSPPPFMLRPLCWKCSVRVKRPRTVHFVQRHAAKWKPWHATNALIYHLQTPGAGLGGLLALRC